MSIVPFLSVYIMSKDRYHVLIRVRVEMMNFVPLVDDVRHHIWKRRVDNGRRDDVRHVSVVFVFGDVELLVGVELAHSGKVNIASKNGNSDGLCRSDMLQLADEP